MALFKKRSNGSRGAADERARGHAEPAHGNRTMSLGDAVPHADPAREQVLQLKRELAEAHAQLDLYQFQIKSLRKDMEQLKMDAVISGLGGYPLSAVNPYGDDAKDPSEPDTDPETIYMLGGAIPGGLETMLDAVQRAHTEIELAAAARPDPDPPPDIPGLQQNLLAALETVSRLDADARALRTSVQNREIQIELLNDRIDIEQQKLHDEYVSREQFDRIVRDAESLDAERRELCARIGQYEDAEQQLAAMRAERDAAEDRAGDLAMQLDGAEHEARILRERYEAFKQESLQREQRMSSESRTAARQLCHLQEQEKQLRRELEQARTAGDKRLDQLTERMRSEYTELQGLMGEYDQAMAELREQVDSLKRDNAVLTERNRKLAAHVKAAHKQAAAESAAVSEDQRKKLVARFGAEPSAEVLLELRQMFLGTRAYQEAVRTFRQLLVDPRNQKFMPAICLLVGEFYKLAGRQEEASFYLANPLIRDDPFAREIIQKIKEAVAEKQAAAKAANPDGKSQ